MMHTDRMTKLSLIGPKSYLKKVIETLHALKVYHIVEHEKGSIDIGTPLDSSSDLSSSLIKVRSLNSYFGFDKEEHKKNYKRGGKEGVLETKNVSTLKNKIEDINSQFLALQAHLKEKDDELSQLNTKKETLSVLSTLDISLDLLQHKSNAVATFVGVLQKEKKEDVFRKALNKITKNYDLHFSFLADHKKIVMVLFAESEKKEEIHSFLNQNNYADVSLDPLQEMVGKPSKALEDIEKKIQIIEKEKVKTTKDITHLGKEHKQFLKSVEVFLREEMEKAEAPLRFAETSEAFLVNGWIPTKQKKKVMSKLEEVTHNKIYLKEEEITKKDAVPIKFANKKLWKPFEFFLDLFSLPNYKEIDPTFLMFITFPLFFGIMLGDVGYGIITFLLFSFLKKKLPSLKQLLNIMIFASLITIVFGGVFGEYMGFEHLSEETGSQLCANTGICFERIEASHGAGEEVQESGIQDHPIDTQTELSSAESSGSGAYDAHHEPTYIYDFPRLMNRAHGHMNLFGMELLSILVIGALIGILHVNFALLIGFYNVYRAHGFMHALYEKASWFVLELGIAVIIFGYQGIGFQPWVGGLLILLSAYMLFKGEGVQGLIEIPSIVSNVLSYMRLGAVGLASVGLAVVVNENLALPLIHQGGLAMVFGILVFVLGHTINIALGVLGPFLHSLRLHYVEFFGRFYHGGGIPYKPFGKKAGE